MKNYFLAWEDKNNKRDFGWFESEEELRNFVETEDVLTVEEALEILNSREINLE